MSCHLAVDENKFIMATKYENDELKTVKLIRNQITENQFDSIISKWYQGKNSEEIFNAIDDIDIVIFGGMRISLKKAQIEGSPLPEKLAMEVVKFVENECTVGKNNSISIPSMIAFLSHLKENSSRKTINNLYSFIGHNDIEIDEEGFVICYKVVKNNFLDVYTGKINNAPGTTVEMERGKVDDDDNQTCSYGLHAASLRYLIESGYGQTGDDWRLVKIRINPKDFVSVPRDYDGSKARVCRYKVVEECSKSLLQKVFS